MAYAPSQRVDVYAHAVRGRLELEPSAERRLTYLDFIDIDADLDDNQRILYQQRSPAEAETRSGFAERFIEQGVQQGESRVLLRLLTRRFGQLPTETVQRIEGADADTLLA